MTGATCEAGTVYPYRAPDYNPDTQSYSNKEKPLSPLSVIHEVWAY